MHNDSDQVRFDYGHDFVGFSNKNPFKFEDFLEYSKNSKWWHVPSLGVSKSHSNFTTKTAVVRLSPSYAELVDVKYKAFASTHYSNIKSGEQFERTGSDFLRQLGVGKEIINKATSYLRINQTEVAFVRVVGEISSTFFGGVTVDNDTKSNWILISGYAFES